MGTWNELYFSFFCFARVRMGVGVKFYTWRYFLSVHDHHFPIYFPQGRLWPQLNVEMLHKRSNQYFILEANKTAIIYYLVPEVLYVYMLLPRWDLVRKPQMLAMGGCLFCMFGHAVWAYTTKDDDFFNSFPLKYVNVPFIIFSHDFENLRKSKQLNSHQIIKAKTYRCGCDEILIWNRNITI